MTPAHDIILSLPPARRHAALRLCDREIITLLQAVYAAVGFPKADGSWSPMLAHDLEAVRVKLEKVQQGGVTNEPEPS